MNILEKEFLVLLLKCVAVVYVVLVILPAIYYIGKYVQANRIISKLKKNSNDRQKLDRIIWEIEEYMKYAKQRMHFSLKDGASLGNPQVMNDCVHALNRSAGYYIYNAKKAFGIPIIKVPKIILKKTGSRFAEILLSMLYKILAIHLFGILPAVVVDFIKKAISIP